MVKDKFVSTLCRRKRSFKLHQNEHDSVKGTDKMAKTKPCKVDLKISMKILFHYLPQPTLPYI